MTEGGRTIKIDRFEDLEVWKDARRLANLVYKLTGESRIAKEFGLRDQMRRAAVSIMSNIAEGFESRTQAMFIEFLGRAKGSAGELRCQAYLAFDQMYLLQAGFDEVYQLVESCSKQLAGLMKYLESKPNTPRIKRSHSLPR